MMKKKYICPSISICEMSVDSIILAASIGFNNEVSDAEQLAKPFTDPFDFEEDEEDADSVQYVCGLNY